MYQLDPVIDGVIVTTAAHTVTASCHLLYLLSLFLDRVTKDIILLVQLDKSLLHRGYGRPQTGISVQ